jgi:hypothetical protein
LCPTDCDEHFDLLLLWSSHGSCSAWRGSSCIMKAALSRVTFYTYRGYTESFLSCIFLFPHFVTKYSIHFSYRIVRSIFCKVNYVEGLKIGESISKTLKILIVMEHLENSSLLKSNSSQVYGLRSYTIVYDEIRRNTMVVYDYRIRREYMIQYDRIRLP